MKRKKRQRVRNRPVGAHPETFAPAESNYPISPYQQLPKPSHIVGVRPPLPIYPSLSCFACSPIIFSVLWHAPLLPDLDVQSLRPRSSIPWARRLARVLPRQSNATTCHVADRPPGTAFPFYVFFHSGISSEQRSFQRRARLRTTAMAPEAAWPVVFATFFFVFPFFVDSGT